MSYKFSERILDYESEGLGLSRETVVLSEHNPRWKRVFSKESLLIQNQLNIESLYLYHCGSTAISGMCAKPIIDIIGSVSSLALLDEQRPLLESIGYAYKGVYGISGRRYCVLYDPEGNRGFVHLHIYASESTAIKDHLVFRDYLRLQADEAKRYDLFKRNLKVPRHQYADSKSVFISSLLKRAYQYQGWNNKVIAVLGAAKGHSNTEDFLNSVHPDVDVHILKDETLSPYNYNSVNEADDFLTIINKTIAADTLILATPVYWYTMSYLMKKFIDRFADLLEGDNKTLGDQLYCKKIQLLATGTDKELPIGFVAPFKLFSTYFGMDFIEVTYKKFG